MTSMTTAYRSSHGRFVREIINPHDIFYGTHYGVTGEKFGHYFYCVYAQAKDINKLLFRDIIGLMITSKPATGYAVQIKLNGKDVFVECDNEVRFIADINLVRVKRFELSEEERKMIIACHDKFTKEKQRQLLEGDKK